MKQKGKRAAREAEELAAFRVAIYLRCGAKPGDPFHEGVCEVCKQVRPLHAHHRLTNPRIHDPKMGHGLCFRCHVFGIHAHENPNWQDWVGPKREGSA